MKLLKTFSVFFLATAMFACGEKESAESKAKDQAKVETTSTAAAPKAKAPVTKMKFEEKEFDFGEITEGDKVTHVFKYTNEGDVPLTITNVRTTCGCTAPNWRREPLAPGETADLTVTFNSAHKKGTQVKRVTVSANVEDGMDVVTIRAKVNPKEDKGTM